MKGICIVGILLLSFNASAEQICRADAAGYVTCKEATWSDTQKMQHEQWQAEQRQQSERFRKQRENIDSVNSGDGLKYYYY